MKDLEEAAYILDIEIYRDRFKRLDGLSQSMQINKMLKWFGMEESKKGFLPMSYGVYISMDMSHNTQIQREHMDKIPYASAIGSIMYEMLCVRPNVSYALSIMSRYQANLDEKYCMDIKNILKYLRWTKDIFLIYGGPELIVQGYKDFSFQSDRDNYKFQSGYVFTLNDDVVN